MAGLCPADAFVHFLVTSSTDSRRCFVFIMMFVIITTLRGNSYSYRYHHHHRRRRRRRRRQAQWNTVGFIPHPKSNLFAFS